MRESLIEEKYRKEFDYFGDRIYFNCCSIGLQPERTRALARRFLDEYTDTFAEPSFGGGDFNRARCRKLAAQMIGADPDEVFLTANTTQGNNVLAFGYPFQAGDEAVVANGDFPTVWLPWAGLQKQGVKMIAADTPDGIVSAELLMEKVTPKTKVIAVSWAQSASGYVTDLVKLGKFCRERGILLSVDAVQGMGRLPADVKKMNVDIFASSSFKGMLGVMGAGFCYCRKEVLEKLDPHMYAGNTDYHTWPEEGFVSAGVPEFYPTSRKMESGTCNHFGYTMMSESMELLMEIGLEKIAAQIRKVETYYRDRLKEKGYPIHMLGSSDPAAWGGNISFTCSDEMIESLQKTAEEKKIWLTARGNMIRVGLHYYNTEDQIDRLIEAMDEAWADRGSCVQGDLPGGNVRNFA